MLEKIIEIAKEVTEGEEIEWGKDTSILMDMGLSSMEFFQFIAEIEGAFGIRISERELNLIETLGDILDLLKKKK